MACISLPPPPISLLLECNAALLAGEGGAALCRALSDVLSRQEASIEAARKVTIKIADSALALIAHIGNSGGKSGYYCRDA